MRRLLFVDDEPLVLAGLRDLLRPKQRHWEMKFVGGGQEAIDEVDRRAFDVVVTDMRMPKIDGAAVLKHVQAVQPNTVRLVLTGHTETELALRTIPVAHQFLSKPCDAATLEATIDRACSLQSLLADPALRAAVGAIGRLPSVPKLYMKINEAMESPNASLKDISALIERDMAVSAKILQVVNSGFFGLPKRVTNVHTAVTFIGINMLRRVLLSVQAFSSFELPPDGEFSVEDLQEHSHFTAMIASRMFKGKRESEDAFTGGILHDIGKLILATRHSPTESPSARPKTTPREGEGTLDVAQGGGITHAEVGAYLLGIWGLPYSVVEAVAYHHHPAAVHHKTFDVVDAVHVADMLAKESNNPRPSTPDPLDSAHLAHLGMDGMLSEWREMAQALRNSEGSA